MLGNAWRYAAVYSIAVVKRAEPGRAFAIMLR
jgi:hypothetical protein